MISIAHSKELNQPAKVDPLDLETIPGAPLEDVLYRGELDRRPSRGPDDLRMGKAVSELLHGFSDKPGSVLQSLTDTIQHVLQCDSAGVSLINAERTRFYWPAITGVLAPHAGEGTPLNFGPCGDVIAFNCSLHMHHMHKRYRYLAAVPPISEALLSPFYFHGEVVGTVWAVMHEPPNDVHSSAREPQPYDREDLRVLEILARLATAAYEIWLRQVQPQLEESGGHTQRQDKIVTSL